MSTRILILKDGVIKPASSSDDLGIGGSSLTLGVTSTTAFRGDFGNTAYNHSLVVSGNPHNVTKASVSLSNVNNTSDINKPVSTSQQTAFDLKVDKVVGSSLVENTSITRLANTSGTNTGDNATNTRYSGLVSNATHTGDATGGTALTLATVNANVGTFNSLTVNAKGLVTAASNVAIPTGTVTSVSSFNAALTVATGTTTPVITVNSAPILTTARTINGIAFNGSSNITINAVDSISRVASSEKGVANGVVPLNSSVLIDSVYLPSYVDDVLEFSNLASFPATGETGKLYVAINTNLVYRWTGSIYAVTSSSLALGTTSTTALRGDYGNTAYLHSQIISGNPHGLTLNSLVGTQTNNRVLRSNGTSTTLSQVSLTTDVINTLPASLGGSGQSSYTIGDILFASTSTALSKLVNVATGNVLLSGGVGVAPSYGKVGLTTHVTGTLPIANGGTGSASQNFVDLTAAQTINGIKTFSNSINVKSMFPGLLLGETDSPANKSAFIVLDGGILQIQRLATASGGYEASIFLMSIITGDVSLSGTVTLSNTTQSTSSTTGALVVAGGIGIGGNIVCTGLPTSSAGLPSGAFWRNGTVVNIVPL